LGVLKAFFVNRKDIGSIKELCFAF